MSLDLPLVLPKPGPLDRIACIAGTTLKFAKMIVKSPSPPPATTKSFHLSHLDQNVVRVYIQTLCIFPFPNQNEVEAAILALNCGLRLTLQSLPFLAGTLSLTDRRSGRLSLEYPSKISDEEMRRVFHSKQIPYDEEHFPYLYGDLKRAGMPPSAFKGSVFVPDDLAIYTGIPAGGEGKVDFNLSDAPVMRIQANFIPGGLVLSTFIHHSVVDCTGVTAFWETFAANICKVSANGDSTNFGSINRAKAESARRQAVDEQLLSTRSDRGSADCYCDGTYSYPKTLPKETKCSQRLFVIPVARIREYRDQIQPHFPKDSQPTMCNVLAALVWTHVTRARATRLTERGYTETNIGIATDLRRRNQPSISPDYMGNMALFSRATLSVSDLTVGKRVTQDTIISVIKKIKNAIRDVNTDWISRHWTFFKSIEQITDTECALALFFGSDLYITSWLNFGADIRWGIPGTDLEKDSLAGRPDFIRRSYAPSDGGVMILPRRRKLVHGTEAPFEVLVRLADEDMDRVLREDGGLGSWVSAVLH